MGSGWIALSRFLPDAPVAEAPDPVVPDEYRLTACTTGDAGGAGLTSPVIAPLIYHEYDNVC